jgi:hypothetical protein
VPGPLDVIGSSGCGALDHSLESAARRALTIPRERCREYALQFSWRYSAEQFLANLCPVPQPSPGDCQRRAAAE